MQEKYAKYEGIKVYRVEPKTRKVSLIIPVKDDDTNNVLTFKKKLVVEEMPF